MNDSTLISDNPTASIASHWDTDAVMSHTSNALVEFKTWREEAMRKDSNWTGNEFTLEDFNDYIKQI
tara:strand:+ start:561 stop:761 length:201 start_codon:yes stop_codon:yes gene_type:complete